jgi:uncharacterized metal-binding protein
MHSLFLSTEGIGQAAVLSALGRDLNKDLLVLGLQVGKAVLLSCNW